jgi:hypothetical protein
MKEDYNKRDCLALIEAKGLKKRFAITSMGGIDRLLYWSKVASNVEVTSEPIRSWTELYAKISAMEIVSQVPANAVSPKGMTDEELIKLGKGE